MRLGHKEGWWEGKITPTPFCPHPCMGNDPKAPQPTAPSCYTLAFIAHTDPVGVGRGGCATLSHFGVGFWAPSLSSVQGGTQEEAQHGAGAEDAASTPRLEV